MHSRIKGDPRPENYKEQLNNYRKFDKVVFGAGDKQTSSLRTSGRGKVHSGLSKYNGPWGMAEAAHLLKRTLFGVRSDELQRFASQSLDQCIIELLQPETALAPPVNNYFSFVSESDAREDVEPGETWVNAKHVDGLSFARQMSLKGWWLRNILNQEARFHQKLMLFWHNLLPTQIFDSGLPGVSYQYVQFLHDHTYGNYKTFIRDLTTNPAMLLFLNGAANVKEAPDENYARELQELFTIGKGPNAGFTESDVFAAARILTGWTVSWDSIVNQGNPQTIYNNYNHDEETKQFSSFYGNRLIYGKTGNKGQEETDELIDMIFENDETALYICRRLYNFFVYHAIDADTEQNVIEPLATIFRDNGYEILPVISTLLSSEHFFDAANRGAYIKSPTDHTLGLLRVSNTPIPTDPSEGYQFLESIYWQMAISGFEIGDPPSVSGWQAYYQQPNYDKIWINTDTITKRAQLQDYLLYSIADIKEFVSTLINPSDPNELIAESAQLLLGIGLDDAASAGLKDILLTGQQTDNYWTSAWNQYINDPGNQEYQVTVETRLQSMFRSMLQLSETQLF